VSDAGPRGGEALERLAAWGRAYTVRRALDVAGDGDTALAVTVAGGGPRAVAGDPGALPFDNGVFDLVTCRLAAHRFPQVALAIREIQRVLAPGGRLLLADRLAPGDTSAGAGSIADPPPLRAYRRPEWHAFLRAAGLTVMEEDTTADRIILLRADKD
jgi:SAM-dependent methyltransferase